MQNITITKVPAGIAYGYGINKNSYDILAEDLILDVNKNPDFNYFERINKRNKRNGKKKT